MVEAGGRLAFSNRRARTLLGEVPKGRVTVEDVVAMYRPHRAGTGEPYPPEETPLIRALRGEACSVDDVELRLPSGPVRVQAWGIPVLDERGRVAYGIVSIEDVTERKRAEEELRQARAEAEGANRAKSDFLSRMSHELRTPLNSILGFAQILEMGDLSHEDRNSVSYIRSGGEHLLQLINEVLDIARIEAGRMSLSVEPVGLVEVVQEVVDMVRSQAAGRTARIEIAHGGDCHVRADRQRLRQVLLNLLGNALKYGGEGVSIVVGVEAKERGRVRVSVSDTGPGIPASKMGRLFLPFERLGAEETEIEGTGIGLALSKALAEAMEGGVGCESEPGRGSTFWVDLPAAADPLVERRSARERRELQELGGPTTILYIEDNVSNVRLMEKLFAERQDATLLSARTGGDGLDLARSAIPDLVLLDLHLPDVGGEEVLRQLRADASTSEIPVVVLSADATAGQIRRLLDAGARDYLTKPLDLKRLMAVIGKAVHGEEDPPEGSMAVGDPGERE